MEIPSTVTNIPSDADTPESVALVRAMNALRFYANARVYRGPNQLPVAGLPTDPTGAFLQDVTRDAGAVASKALNDIQALVEPIATHVPIEAGMI